MSLPDRDSINHPSDADRPMDGEREREPEPQNSEDADQPDTLPYCLASRFRGEPAAGRTYFRLQDLLLRSPDANLSAFRFQLSRISHVAVVGTPPPEELARRVQRILAAGEPVSLPVEVIVLLQQRRARASQEGEWVERHFRPGEPL